MEARVSPRRASRSQGQRKLLELVGFFRGNAASSVQLR
jgi:hypothetical protein